MNDVDARGKSEPPGRARGFAQRMAQADGGAPVFREPGWYRDPEQPRWHRYWDGNAWLPYRPNLDREPVQEEETTQAQELPHPRRHID